MIRIKNFNVVFDDKTPLNILVANRLKLPLQQIAEVVIVRKGIDARRYHGAPIHFVYILDVTVKLPEKKVMAKLRRDKNVEQILPTKSKHFVPKKPKDMRPVIVGFGPAGMFAGLTLAKQGYAPIIFERGADVDTRHKDIEQFWQGKGLNIKSNVQFGEGGAGTFSDGKLTTRINDEKIGSILADFVDAGAPEEIKYLHKPHIGTDILRKVVKTFARK